MKGFIEVTAIRHGIQEIEYPVLLNLNSVCTISLGGEGEHSITMSNEELFNVSETDFKRIMAEIKS